MPEPSDHAKPDAEAPPAFGGGEQRVFTVVVAALGVLAALVPFLLGNRPDLGAVLEDGAPQNPPRRLGDFTLTNSAGLPVSRADLADKVLVVNFVSSSCSRWCLDISRRVRDAERELADAQEVRFLSLTIDPRSDPPPVLARYAASLDANTNRWFFLTGAKPAVYQFIEQSFLRRRPEAGPGETDGGFDGVSRIVLVDRQGIVRRYLNGLSPTLADRIVAEVRKLRAETQEP